MAPPTKRRCLFFCSSKHVQSSAEHNFSTEFHGFAHTVGELEMPLDGEEAKLEDQAQAHHTKEEVKRQAVSVVVAVSAVVVQADVTVALDALTAATVETTSSVAGAISSTFVDASTSLAVSSSQPSSTIAAPLSVAAAPVSSSAIVAASSTPGVALSTTSGVALSASSAVSTTVTPLSSAYLLTSSSSKNTTMLADSSTGSQSLNSSTTRVSSSSSSSSMLPSQYSNSSLGLNATYSLTATSTDLTTTSDNGRASSTLTIFTTTGADGQPYTITSIVGVAATGTSLQSSSSDPAVATGSSTTATAAPAPGTIAGGVVGGAAGLAVLLLVAMLFLRWFRQRSQRNHQPLLPADGYSDSPNPSRRGPGMAEGAGIRPLLSTVPVLFRHQQHPAKDNTLPLPGNERGFQRLSGRKLPSAFSPGMDHGQRPPPGFAVVPPMPLAPVSSRSGNVSPESSLLSRQTTDEQMTMLPGPQRRPTIHNHHAPLQVPGASSHSRHVSLAARTSGILS